MKIVVTGGLGYVGSFLVRQLPAAFPKAQLLILDNLSTGRREALKGIEGKKSFQFIRGDVRAFDFKKLQLSPSDFIVHLAGLSRPLESFGKTEDFFSVNCEGAAHTAKACAQAGAAFLFPSTTSVYHQTGKKWIHGCGSHLRPQTPYAASKLAAEKKLSEIPQLRYTIVRFGTIYGASPVISKETAVNKFCWQAATGKPVSVWKTALDQYRPYLDLKDAGRLILFLIKQREFSGKTFNAVTNHTTPEQVLRVIRRFHQSVKVQCVPSKAMNRLSYKVSRKPLERLGFEFRGDLQQSVQEILNACRA